ncbi:MAG: permease-like cell division protein FtsX [Rhodocyclaceae bacterium]|nr:ABC transporter permease [Rhodocyclaceae bacterium]MBX3671082.1 permease-like cell division protein FtsX [Rhodocyclaceae bacterium]
MKSWLAQHGQAAARALGRLARAPFGTLLASIVVGVAAVLPAGGWLLLDNIERLADKAAVLPQISVFMAADASADDVAGVQKALRAKVSGVQYVPRKSTLQRIRALEGMGEVLDALPDNPFPDAFIVTPESDDAQALEALKAAFSQLPKVEHVQLDSAWVRRLNAFVTLAQTALWLLAGLLGVALVAVTFNTIRLQILTQQEEVRVSRLLGATTTFIRRPFYWFGTLQGLGGGLVAWALLWLFARALAAPAQELAGLYSLEFALHTLPPQAVLCLLASTAALGWLGAAASLWRNLAD